MKLYFKIVAMHIKSQLQHRTAFLALSLGQALLTFSGIFAVIILATNVTTVAGFSTPEILLAGAVVTLSFAIANVSFEGLIPFHGCWGTVNLIVSSSDLKMCCFGLREHNGIKSVGKNCGCEYYSCGGLSDCSALYHIRLLAIMVVSGVVLFGSLFIIYGSCSFFTTDSLEVFNILTDGGREFGQVPYGLYGKNILKVLTFILPLACFQYYPLLVVLGRDVPTYFQWTPLACFLFVIPALLMWRRGRHHYRSTGS
ncbi:ABC-2 family transporter protein [Erysipelothrix sp. D19-032]